MGTTQYQCVCACMCACVCVLCMCNVCMMLIAVEDFDVTSLDSFVNVFFVRHHFFLIRDKPTATDIALDLQDDWIDLTAVSSPVHGFNHYVVRATPCYQCLHWVN